MELGIWGGGTAENVAAEYDISRAAQDSFALESQNRTARAIKNGYFAEQIRPVEIKTHKGVTVFDTDEHPKSTSAEILTGLRPAFRKDGTVTAGNTSGLNDGAGAIILARRDVAEAAGLAPRFRIVGYGQTGVRPEVMGIGSVPAVNKLLQKTGVKISDFDVIQSHEAFAAQALTVNKVLGVNPDRVNPNGWATSLGHPIGASGAIIVLKLMYELERTGGQYGLATMCIGGGQGIALAIESL